MQMLRFIIAAAAFFGAWSVHAQAAAPIDNQEMRDDFQEFSRFYPSHDERTDRHPGNQQCEDKQEGSHAHGQDSEHAADSDRHDENCVPVVDDDVGDRNSDDFGRR